MTVGELIEELNKFDKDTMFVLSHDTYGTTTDLRLTIIRKVLSAQSGEYIKLDQAITIEAKED